MEPSEQEPLASDFQASKSNWIKFSKKELNLLPHDTTDYQWKDYCPAVFRFFFFSSLSFRFMVAVSCYLEENKENLY